MSNLNNPSAKALRSLNARHTRLGRFIFTGLFFFSSPSQPTSTKGQLSRGMCLNSVWFQTRGGHPIYKNDWRSDVMLFFEG